MNARASHEMYLGPASPLGRRDDNRSVGGHVHRRHGAPPFSGWQSFLSLSEHPNDSVASRNSPVIVRAESKVAKLT